MLGSSFSKERRDIVEKIVDYELISGEDYEGVANRTRAAKKEGWSPLGPCQVAIAANNGIRHELYCQTIVKTKSIPDLEIGRSQ